MAVRQIGKRDPGIKRSGRVKISARNMLERR